MAKVNPNINRRGKPAVESELLDFSNDPWSWKGKAPSYPITPDGFTFDIDNENGLDRKAISLGILGMVIIVFNAKSATIREEEVLPVFFEVIGTRSWLTLTRKEAGISAKTVISKLTDAESSGDVFDLCSFAPLEIKRALIRMLFKVARLRFKPEFKEEAETRIIEDIVPSIFEDPAYELALLTGNIIREESSSEPELPPQTVAPTDSFNPYDAPTIPEIAAAAVPAAQEQEESTQAEPQTVSDRDAEEALRERMEQLTKAVPNLPPRPVETHEDDYVPFSDMENDPEFHAAKAAAPVQPSPQHAEAPVPAPAQPAAPVSAPKPARRSRYPEQDIAAELYAQSSYSSGINAPTTPAPGMMEAGGEYGFVPTPPAFNYETGELPQASAQSQAVPPQVSPQQPQPLPPQSQPQAGGGPVSGYPQSYPQPYPQGYPQGYPPQGGANFANVPNFGPAPTFAQPTGSQYPAGYPQPAQMPNFSNVPNFGQPPAFAQTPPVQNMNPQQSSYPQPYPPSYPQGYPQPPYPQTPNYPQGWQQGQPHPGYPQASYPGAVPPVPPNPTVPPTTDDLNTTAPRKAV